MSARVTQIGTAPKPRTTFETPTFHVQEWPEHVAVCRVAIRARRMAEAEYQRRDGTWA